MDLLLKGRPRPGPKSGLLSNTRKRSVWGYTCPYKAKDFIGKGRPGREQWDEGTQEGVPSSWAEGSSASWLTVSVFMVMGLAYKVVCGQSSCLCPLLVWLKVDTCVHFWSWWHQDLSAKGGFLGGWQDILWVGDSSLLLAPPKFSWLVFSGSTVLLMAISDLLLWDSSCKWLLPCLTQADSFGQQFSNRFSCAAHFI